MTFPSFIATIAILLILLLAVLIGTYPVIIVALGTVVFGTLSFLILAVIWFCIRDAIVDLLRSR